GGWDHRAVPRAELADRPVPRGRGGAEPRRAPVALARSGRTAGAVGRGIRRLRRARGGPAGLSPQYRPARRTLAGETYPGTLGLVRQSTSGRRPRPRIRLQDDRRPPVHDDAVLGVPLHRAGEHEALDIRAAALQLGG